MVYSSARRGEELITSPLQLQAGPEVASLFRHGSVACGGRGRGDITDSQSPVNGVGMFFRHMLAHSDRYRRLSVIHFREPGERDCATKHHYYRQMGRAQKLGGGMGS